MNRELVIPGGAGIYPLAGDVGSQAGSSQVTVKGIQNVPVSGTPPAAQQYMKYDDSSHMWVATSIADSGNKVFATPDGAAGDAALRNLVSNDLPIADTSSRGAVIPDGTTITVDGSGRISSIPGSVPIATTSTVGVVKPDGTTIAIDGSGKISIVGGGVGASRGPLQSNADGWWWVWSDGVIDQWGKITLVATGTKWTSGVVVFPTAFATACQTFSLSINGLPQTGLASTAEVQSTSVSTIGIGVNLQCSVPMGGGGSVFNNAVEVWWSARGI